MNPHEVLSSDAANRRLSADERLETLLVHLLSQLEQQMISLERTDNVKRLIRMVESALGMLVAIIDTGVDNFDVSFFSHELPAVWRLRERSKIVLDVLDREAWSSVFGFGPKAAAATIQLHRNLGRHFAHIFRELLARFGAEFQLEELRNGWRESCNVFVEDFGERW